VTLAQHTALKRALFPMLAGLLVTVLSCCALLRPGLSRPYDVSGTIELPSPEVPGTISMLRVDVMNVQTGASAGYSASEMKGGSGGEVIYGLDLAPSVRREGGNYWVMAYLDANRNHRFDAGETHTSPPPRWLHYSVPERSASVEKARPGLNLLVDQEAVAWGKITAYNLRFF